MSSLRLRFKLLIAAALLCGVFLTGAAVAKTSPITYHLEMYHEDDGYALCADGQFIITVNGADSIYFRCVEE